MAGYSARQSSFTTGDTILAAHSNDEFNQVLAAFHATTGHSHDGTAGEGGPISTLRDADSLNKILVDTTNNHLEFYVEVSSAAVQQLRIQDGAIVPITDNDIDLGTSSLEFKDAFFDGTITTDALVADTADLNGGSVDGATLGTNSAITQAVIDNININGATIGHTDDTDLLTLADGILTVAGEVSMTTLDIGGTNITSTAAELNIVDGGTSATSTTVADADRVVLNDNGTMVQVAVTDLAAYFDDEITAMPNLVTTAATTVGALDSGSITSGFGTIDTGSSTITTTGLITGGSLDIDDVLINGTTIGHTDDTDLITLANGIATVAGEISVTTLDIGGTDVTATASEINLIDGGASIGTDAIADGDGIIHNDGGTMKVTSAATFKTYFTSGAGTAADDISAGDAAVNITTSSGNITIDAAANNTDIIFKGTDDSSDITMLTLDGSDAGSATFNHDIILGNDSFVQFGDAGEKMVGDGTDLTINSSNDLNLTATTDINIPANVGLTFGDDGEKIEGDGTDLTIAGNNINLTAVADVVIPANVGITFGSGEKIEGDSTDLTVTSGGAINLTATTDVVIPNNVGIQFGGASEKIEGDGTDLVISANNLTIDAAADIILDAAGNDFNFKADGTEVLRITNSSSDVIIRPVVDAKDIIFQQADGTEVARVEDNGTFNVVTDKLAINGTAVTSTATELNKLDGAGTIKQAGKETIWVPAVAMYPNTTNGCAAVAQVELSNGPEIKTLDFDKDSDEFAQFAVAFPKSWNEGTVTFQAFFTADSTNTGTTAWGLSGVSLADNDSCNTAFGTQVVATAKAHSGTANDLNVTAESGAVTIAGSPSTDEQVFFQVSRDVSADDLTADAKLLGIKLFFTTDAANDA